MRKLAGLVAGVGLALACAVPATAATIPFRTTGNAVCHVVEGNGMSRIGEDTIHWGAKDIFSLPHGNWITHLAEADTATMFLVTDRDALRRLDLLKEQYGNDPR